MRLIALFEEQYPDSPGYLYDQLPYLLAFSALVVYRAGCELKGESEKYKPSAQLDALGLAPAMKIEIEEFLVKNQLDRPETYSVFATGR